MARLMESIERYGIMNPLIVMPTTEGFYRIISGHRRKYCAEKLGYTKVPAIIRYMKEDDSIISMVNSNLHKEKIRSRFGYSSTMDTRFCFVYQLSQRMMIWSLLWNSGITCRIMEAASSSLDSFFSGCFCDILIRGRIRPEGKYYVTKIICFFQERNRFVNCSDPGASFYVLGQTG